MRTIFLGIKLLISFATIELKRPSYLGSRPNSLRELKKEFKELVMGSLVLSCFIRVAKSFIHFATTRKQQEELIYLFFSMTKLIEKGFGDKKNPIVLTLESFPDIITLRNNSHNDILISELQDTVRRIKKLASNNQHYSSFESNVIKTWSTHRVRDVKQTGGRTISFDEALKAAEDRGGFYFLALVYLLNPMGLDENSERLVLLSGAWFQIIDDYDDRKIDVDNRNTSFTVSSGGSHKEIRKKYMAKYQKEIRATISSRTHGLVIFFRGLTGLVTIKPIILGEKSDWH